MQEITPQTRTTLRPRRLWVPWLLMGLAGLLMGSTTLPFPASGGTQERPCERAKPGERISVDFRDTPVRDVARIVACALELNLIFSPPALGDRRVTVVAPRPVPASDLLQILESGLRTASLVLEKRGAYGVIRATRIQAPSKRRSNNGR